MEQCVEKCNRTFRAGDFTHTQCVSYCRNPSVGAQVSALAASSPVLNLVLLLVGAALIGYGVNELRK